MFPLGHPGPLGRITNYSQLWFIVESGHQFLPNHMG